MTQPATASAGLSPFQQVLANLSEPLKDDLIKQHDGFNYVEWFTVADLLDMYAPEWISSISDVRIVEARSLILVTVALTIDGVTREGMGVGHLDSEAGIKTAEHDALKRAAVKFGVARDLYRGHHHPAAETQRPDNKQLSKALDELPTPKAAETAGLPPSNIAKNLGELVSAKQLGMIRALSRELRIDVDEVCHSVLSCRSDELTKQAASKFIQHLQDMQRESSPDFQIPVDQSAPSQGGGPATINDPLETPKANGNGKPKYEPAPKPTTGTFKDPAGAATVPQLTMLSHIAIANHCAIENLIKPDFPDVTGASALSKTAASFLIDKYQKK